ncbi:MAG: CooT family nickel-binding protein [Thermoplasmata archaeon]|nr:MAG: CooT family nickel-binding protein [Thermoplasmata archaeon]
MCESNVFLHTEDDFSEFMQNVVKIEVFDDKVICINLLGDRKEVEGVRITEANLLEHRIVLGKL